MVDSRADLLQSSFANDGVPDAGESRDLLSRAQQGDAAAVNDLLARYQGRVQRIVRVQLGPRLRTVLESMDVVQDTLQQAAQALAGDPSLRQRNLLRWLSQIALNRIRDANDYHFAERRNRGRESPLAPVEDADQPPAADPPSPHTRVDERAMKNEVRELLDEAVAGLPEEYRSVILLRDYCGHDWEAITAELQRPNSHATRQLHQRAWIRVRQILWPRLKDAT
jgi:RNA polymerase sigma-70 factor (ECF subfamily)